MVQYFHCKILEFPTKTSVSMSFPVYLLHFFRSRNQALESQQGVEVAVPDTWVQLDDLPKPPRGPKPQSTEMCEANPRCKVRGRSWFFGGLTRCWGDWITSLVGGDWNMTGLFSHIGNVIIPIDFHIFQRYVITTKQISVWRAIYPTGFFRPRGPSRLFLDPLNMPCMM